MRVRTPGRAGSVLLPLLAVGLAGCSNRPPMELDTQLQGAALVADVAAGREALKAGANPNCVSPEIDQTVVDHLIGRGRDAQSEGRQIAFLKLLLQNGLDRTFLHSRGPRDAGPLARAAGAGYPKLVAYLLQFQPSERDLQNAIRAAHARDFEGYENWQVYRQIERTLLRRQTGNPRAELKGH